VAALKQAERGLIKSHEEEAIAISQAFGAAVRQSPLCAAFDAVLLSAFAADAEIKALGIEFAVTRDDYSGSKAFGLAEPRQIHAFSAVPPASLDDGWSEEHDASSEDGTNRSMVADTIDAALAALPGLTLCALLNGDSLLGEDLEEIEVLLVLTPDLQASFYQPGDDFASWEKM
jgi:hypothetical protein